jgi:hypothetical protein
MYMNYARLCGECLYLPAGHGTSVSVHSHRLPVTKNVVNPSGRRRARHRQISAWQIQPAFALSGQGRLTIHATFQHNLNKINSINNLMAPFSALPEPENVTLRRHAAENFSILAAGLGPSWRRPRLSADPVSESEINALLQIL